MYMLMCYVGVQGSHWRKGDGGNLPEWISGLQVRSTVKDSSHDKAVMTSSEDKFPKSMLAYTESGRQFGNIHNQGWKTLFKFIRKHLAPDAKVAVYDFGAGDFAALFCLTIAGVVAVAGIEAEFHRFLEMLDKAGLYSYGMYKDIVMV